MQTLLLLLIYLLIFFFKIKRSLNCLYLKLFLWVEYQDPSLYLKSLETIQILRERQNDPKVLIKYYVNTTKILCFIAFYCGKELTLLIMY